MILSTNRLEEPTWGLIYLCFIYVEGFPGGSDGTESAHGARDLGSIPGLTDPLEEGMAAHSSVLAWTAPMGGGAGGLQSVGLQRARHDWSGSAQHVHLSSWLSLPAALGRRARGDGTEVAVVSLICIHSSAGALWNLGEGRLPVLAFQVGDWNQRGATLAFPKADVQ